MRSRNSRNASQRCPHSWPSRLQRVVLAEEFLRRVVRIFAEPVHHHEAAQAAGAAEIGGTDRRCPTPMPADFVLHRGLVRERVGDERRIRPGDELIVVVGMGLVELLRQRDEIELRALREALADGAGAAGGRARVTQVDRA